MKKQKTESYTVNRLSSISGTDRRTWEKRLADFKPVRTRGRLKFYSAEDALRSLRSGRVNANPNADLERKRLELAIDRQEFAKQKERKEYIKTIDAKFVAVRMIAQLRKGLIDIPPRASAKLALMTDQVKIEMYLESEIFQVLAEASRADIAQVDCPNCKQRIPINSK